MSLISPLAPIGPISLIIPIGRIVRIALIKSTRERLGGFYTVEQILEVRYVEPSMLKWFTVDTTQIRHFRISDMSFAEMSRHPYIGYDKAKAISNFQRLYGPITDMEQLRATTIFTDEELEKLQNYIF